MGEPPGSRGNLGSPVEKPVRRDRVADPDDARMPPGEWTLNPYRGCSHACRYCFARPTHTRLALNMAGDFDREIIVKVDIAEVLKGELARRRKLPPRVAFTGDPRGAPGPHGLPRPRPARTE